MTESKTDASTSEVEATLDNAELAEVQGGLDLTAAIRSTALDRNLVSTLRQRLLGGGLKGNTNYHIKDSGPSWVDSPRHFDRGDVLINPVTFR